MDLKDFQFDHKFNIGKDSEDLKNLIGSFDCESFMGDIAKLITFIDTPRIQIYPFQGLDSPYRQLTYFACLNLSSPIDAIKNKEVESDEKWKEIVVQFLKVRAGYYEELLPKEGQESDEFLKFYKVAMPVFNNYFDTGNLDYEEQEVERVSSCFTPFDGLVCEKTGLLTKEFIDIYNIIFESLEAAPNRVHHIKNSDPEARAYMDKMKELKTHPHDFAYDGPNDNIKFLVEFFRDRGGRFTVALEKLCASYDETKVKAFISHFSIVRSDDPEYLYYTQPNKVLLKPLFVRKDGRLLIVDIKQLIHSIYRFLHEVLTSSPKSEAFYSRRGKELQNKTAVLFKDFFGASALIYNEYKVNGNAQDVLVLNKGLALIIEVKSNKEFRFSGILIQSISISSSWGLLRGVSRKATISVGGSKNYSILSKASIYSTSKTNFSTQLRRDDIRRFSQ